MSTDPRSARRRVVPATTLMLALLAVVSVASPIRVPVASAESAGRARIGVAGSHRATAATRPGPAVNPHWSPNGCRYCHKLEGDSAQRIKATDIDALCLRCHDGPHGKREAHPVGRTFTSEQVVHPEGWPIPGEKLRCVTCHDVLRACRHPAKRPKINPGFVRGYEGGGLISFCARCHVESDQDRPYTPHVMLDENKQVIQWKCLFCHREPMDVTGRTERTGKPALRAGGVILCVRCHNRHVDYFEPGHVGARVPDSMRAYVAAARLPLENGDTVVCATCHNPHAEGVFQAGSVLARGARSFGEKPVRLPRRGFGKDVCRACHDK